MAQPASYHLAYSFQGWQVSNPSRPLPADRIENEFNDVALTLSQTLANLALIQRDDTGLANASVGLDQLKPEIFAGIPQPTAWATNTPYKKGDTVFSVSSLYRNLVAHTSGVFANDLAAGNWLLLTNLIAGLPLVNTFNARNGAVVPLVGDYSAFYQGLNANLTALAGLVSAVDQLPYFTGSGTAALTSMPSYARSLISAASASAARGTLGLAAIAASGSASDLISGTVPAAQMPAHTGDVTSSAGSVALTIAIGAAVANIGYTPVNKAGDTFTGNVTINTGGVSYLILNSIAASSRGVVYQTAGTSRWLFGMDTSTESGSNAGGNFVVANYSDAGSLLNLAISIARATGNVTFAANTSVPASGYRNFGATFGASGYGLFDSAGTIQAKNSGGSWSNILTSALVTGDVTFSNYASTIAAGAVTYAKMQNVSATARVLGRKTAGAGVVEELANTDINTIINSTVAPVFANNTSKPTTVAGYGITDAVTPTTLNGGTLPASVTTLAATNISVAANQGLSVSPTGNPTGGALLATLTSETLQAALSSTTNREFALNIGATVTQGNGVANGNGDKVGIYSGVISSGASAGNMWAFNPLVTANTGYLGTAQVIEADGNNLAAHRGDTDGSGGLTAPNFYGIAATGASTFRKTSAFLVSENANMWNRGFTVANNSISTTGSAFADYGTSHSKSIDIRGTPTYGVYQFSPTPINYFAGFVYLGNGDQTATPGTGGAAVISGPRATGTDIAGGNLVLRGGSSTGAAGGGGIILQTSVAAGSGAGINAVQTIALYSPNAYVFGTGESTATPGAPVFRGANATGSNIAGGSLTIQPGNGTGTGGSGPVILQTAPAGTTGSTANTMAEVFRVDASGANFYKTTANAVNTSATLSVAQIQGRIITSTTAAGVTMTMPTGAVLDTVGTGLGSIALPNNATIDFTVKNTGGTNAITMAVASGVTNGGAAGDLTIAANLTATYRLQKTGANTFVLYKM